MPLGRLLLTLALGAAGLCLSSGLRASDAEGASGTAAEDPSLEVDRPGEVENPYSLLPGKGQWLNYLLAADPQGRSAQDLGSGGSATVVQSELRLGLAPAWEAQVLATAYLNGIDKGPDGDDPGTSHSGIGLITLRAKWTFYSEKDGDFALALVPALTVPTNRVLAGRSGVEPGLILPFDVDFEHGFELQGSAAVTDGHGDDGGRSTEGEMQAGIEYTFTPAASAYIEPECEIGEGRPSWALEQGITLRLTRRFAIDFGFNEGLGSGRHAHFGYAGVAVGF